MAAAEAAADPQLMLGVALIEKDTNGEVLWAWCYPSTTASTRALLLRKCCLTAENQLLHPFVFGQHDRMWIYITTAEVPDSSVLKKVTHFSIVLTAKDFNPEKYAAFTRIWCRTLPALVWHRQDWTILHPFVHLQVDELEALQVCTGYVAGFVDPEVSNRPDLYDVFVNLADSEITIAPLAKENMSHEGLERAQRWIPGNSYEACQEHF